MSRLRALKNLFEIIIFLCIISMNIYEKGDTEYAVSKMRKHELTDSNRDRDKRQRLFIWKGLLWSNSIRTNWNSLWCMW